MPTSPTEGSRPTAQPAPALVLGVDVGGTKTALVLADAERGAMLARERFATPEHCRPEALLAAVRARAEALCAAAGAGLGDVRAVGVAVPGRVDAAGRVLLAGNLEGWRDYALRETWEGAFGAPTFVEQDANAGALGERWRGCAKGMTDFVFLALGTGVGAGLVVGGRLHRGAHHAAGELGDLVTAAGRRLGGPGAWETLAERVGGKAIRARAQADAGAALPASEAIARAEDDARLRALADEVADQVALAVIAVAVTLDPEAIVLGGGTAAAGEALLEPVRARLEDRLPIPPVLLTSALGEDAHLYGAVFGALCRLDPALARGEGAAGAR